MARRTLVSSTKDETWLHVLLFICHIRIRNNIGRTVPCGTLLNTLSKTNSVKTCALHLTLGILTSDKTYCDWLKFPGDLILDQTFHDWLKYPGQIIGDCQGILATEVLRVKILAY